MRLLLWGILVAALSYTQAYPEHGALRDSLMKKARLRRQNCDSCYTEGVIEDVAKQLEQQRLFIEERARSEGASGVKQSRLTRKGSRPYHSTSYTGDSIVAAHEHSNNNRVSGLGEFIAVLNGVEFRTRHNDYRLVMPHRTDGGYEAVEDIPYPEVPPAVTALPDAEDQIVEMREWFKAWRDQDYSVRDYRPYFKPVLCYLEGAWTLPEGTAIDESFESDRHHIDATTWFDLQEKIKFTSYSGKKDKDENFAYLPTTVIKVITNGTVQLVIAQWNYRILCHPMSRDLPTSRLRLIDDLQSRMAYKTSMDNHEGSRAARFQLNSDDTDTWSEKQKVHELIDEFMEEIPGKENYIGDLEDDSLGMTSKKYGSSDPVNAAYYHGWFTGPKDAMGVTLQHRGYADENVFMALTTQEKVAPMSANKCTTKKGTTTCVTYTQRWSYAIPLEILYMTPLYNWNPHNIEHKGWSGSSNGVTVTAGGRNGALSLDKAFNGSSNVNYYRTPAGFVTDDNGSGSSADTAGGIKAALDVNGDMHNVIASGTRILLPDIPGVGVLRVRYPIMPTHVGGGATWKELDALKELLLRPDVYKRMYYYYGIEEPESSVQPLKSSVAGVGGRTHIHYVMLQRDQVNGMSNGASNVTMETSKDPIDGHFHTMTITRNSRGIFEFTECDGQAKCPDGHENRMFCIPNKNCVG